MSKYIPGNQKHLTLEDRVYIENELAKGTSFKNIAAFLCKDPTTISKEVKAHRISDWYHKGTFYNAKNFCVHRYHCRKTNACGKIILCGVKCSSCPTCNQTCRDFEKERCSRLDKAPYVCNVQRRSVSLRIRLLPTIRNWNYQSEPCTAIWIRDCSQHVMLI